ncbi:MAG: S8 family peptidase [Defluviitaleaceae bacterium]|nr:S8 family peptidase [Defluviitaleaceae bacterium]
METLYEYAQRPDIIDVIVRYNRRLMKFAKENQYLMLGKVYSEGWVIAYLPGDKLGDFLSAMNLGQVSVVPKIMTLMGRESLVASGILQLQQRPHMDLRGRGVLLGFIDTGIDYTKDAFIYEDGTSKIKYIWDQTIQTAPVENGVIFGTAYDQSELSGALRSESPFDIVPHRDTVGHGTFLASVAGSREDSDYIGAAPDAEIIMVKLRKMRPFYTSRFRVPEGQENVFSSADVILGIKYIVDKAEELDRPVSICISVGSTFGSHDSFGNIENYLMRLAPLVGIAINVAAGNESNARRHFEGLVKTGETTDFEVRVGPDMRHAVVYIWCMPQDIMHLSVKSPGGEVVTSRSGLVDVYFSQRLILENSVVHINYHFPNEGSGNNLLVVNLDTPTPGIWTISVHGELILDGVFNAWMPATGISYPDVDFVSPSPYNTIVNPGTALNVTTCGAYDRRNNSLMPGSSWGPSRFNIMLPDIVAPGVDVSGVYPWGYGTMSGTSVATAITTGAAALMLQWGIVNGNYPTLNNLRLRAFLMQGCTRDTDKTYPNNQWGYGRLDLMETFNVLRRL